MIRTVRTDKPFSTKCFISRMYFESSGANRRESKNWFRCCGFSLNTSYSYKGLKTRPFQSLANDLPLNQGTTIHGF